MALDTKRKPYVALTYIFWDMVDFPLPENLPIAEFYDTVESSLYKYGFGCNMEILAYADTLKCNPDDDDCCFIHPNIRVCALLNRFVRVSTAAIDMVRSTSESRWAISETNLMLIIKDTKKKVSVVRNVIRALLDEGYGITLVVADEGEDGDIHSAYPYLTDKELSRITLWNWSSLRKGDGPFIFEAGNQGRSPKRLKMYDAGSVGDADYA